jgi:hypothetical protein
MKLLYIGCFILVEWSKENGAYMYDVFSNFLLSRISTVPLRDVRGDGKETQCLGLYLGHPVPGGYRYGDLALQVGGIS